MDKVEKDKLLEILSQRNQSQEPSDTRDHEPNPVAAAEPSAHAEKRKHQRVRFASNVKVILSSGEEVSVYCDNISLGGLLLNSTYPADKGTQLNIIIPLSIDGSTKMIRVKAQVVHTHLGSPDMGGNIIGMKFLEMNHSAEKLLTLYVDIRVKRGFSLS